MTVYCAKPDGFIRRAKQIKAAEFKAEKQKPYEWLVERVS